MSGGERGWIRLRTLLLLLVMAAAMAAGWLALQRIRQMPLAADLGDDGAPVPVTAAPDLDTVPTGRHPASVGSRPPVPRDGRPSPDATVYGSAPPPDVRYMLDEVPSAIAETNRTRARLVIPSFPWPPPKPSGTRDVPIDWLVDERATAHLSDLDARLSAALDQFGYAQRSYYGVPDGFALVTRVERILSDGSPAPGSDRWAIDDDRMQILSLVDYLKALFLARPGRFRVLVFTVTPQEFVPDGPTVTAAEALELLMSGFPRLPDAIGSIALASAAFHCTALVYEFERAAETDPARTVVPGHLDVGDHLVRSGVWGAIAP